MIIIYYYHQLLNYDTSSLKLHFLTSKVESNISKYTSTAFPKKYRIMVVFHTTWFLINILREPYHNKWTIACTLLLNMVLTVTVNVVMSCRAER